MLESFFPIGIQHYALGGLLVGLGTALIYLLTGIYGGASSVLTTTWSYLVHDKFFDTKDNRSMRGRKLVFSAGLIAGGSLFWFGFNNGQAFLTSVQWWRLLLGGFLVGLGARLGRGCTSGHGICGISAGSGASVSFVIVFMIIAIITAQLVQLLGVLP